MVIREAAATAAPASARSFDQLLEALQDDEWADPEQAANALGRFRDTRAVDPLMVALKDKDGAVRTAAVWALERIGDSRATPGLIEALTDGTVREYVARVLKKIGDTRAVDALIRWTSWSQLDGSASCGQRRLERSATRAAPRR